MWVLQENTISQETSGKSQNVCMLYGLYKIKRSFLLRDIDPCSFIIIIVIIIFSTLISSSISLSFRPLVWIGPIYVKQVDNSSLFSLLLSIIIGLLGKLAFSRNIAKVLKDFIRKDLDPAQLSVLKGALPTSSSGSVIDHLTKGRDALTERKVKVWLPFQHQW